jgi:hypothetical protein
MSTEITQPRKASEPTLETMKTTAVDQVASFLLSMAIMFGLAVALLGMLFFMSIYRAPLRDIVLEAEPISGRGDNPPGFERDLEPPSAEEVEQLTEPTPEQALQAVTEMVSSIASTLESAEAAASEGAGKGDSRPPGPEGEGIDVVPRFERWDLKFSAKDSKGYAKQLDFFKMELAAVGGGRTEVDYLAEMSTSAKKRSGAGDAEKRIYFVNKTEGGLAKYEKDFLVKSGIPTSGRLVLKLISKELEEDLAKREILYAREKRGEKVSVKELAKTVFDCQPGASNGFQWVVIEQRYRVPK